MSKSTAEIRQAFLDFFQNKGHKIINSSSLVPAHDKTLLFTNAGMNQFKNVFLGQEKRTYTRATSVQRCVRAGGKHNDLEKVGYTSRHHTFFEMLGNFSFGDYFKKEAISFAWELLTSPQWFALPKDKLWVTVYATDDESFNIWEKEIGIPPIRIIRIGDNKGAPYLSDNFWQMSETGPCGPCSEIFFDHGEDVFGDPPGSLGEEGDRYIEIWNLVFMQFNRQSNGSMLPLPQPSVDTGMGLERITAVLQDVNSNYNIDIFKELIQSIAQVIGTTDLKNKSLHVIADHIRACAFLIADGILPSNENRSYVLRRLIRRAVRHGYDLGAPKNFFFKLIDPLIHAMGPVGHDLRHQKKRIESVLKIEEEQCSKTLEKGLIILETELNRLSGDTLQGDILFRLYDTFGFPIELIEDICRNRGLKVDKYGFLHEMKKQRQRSRNASNFHIDYSNQLFINHTSEFKGYKCLTLHAIIILIIVNGKIVDTICAGQNGIIILESTPFYPEGGGQIGDSGQLKSHNNACFTVNDTKKYNKAISHHGTMKNGIFNKGDDIIAQVCQEKRKRICLNHSATHLLQASLRLLLGKHVSQKGSFINDKILRFDFSHHQVINKEDLRKIEMIVNKQIRYNLPVEVNTMELEKAISRGAMALFSETYGKYVRVLEMGGFSVELCGGTHVEHTGNIGLFHIISESSAASGIRRIEATTGEEALFYIYQKNDILTELCQLVKTNQCQIKNKVQTLIKQKNTVEKNLNKIKFQQAVQKSKLLRNKAIKIKNIQLLVDHLEYLEPEMLRLIVDHLKNYFSSSTIIILSTVINNKISLIVSVSLDLTKNFKASDLIKTLAQQVNGKGGGSQQLAQAYGLNIQALPMALSSIKEWIPTQLK
ncbi:alanine--tRNA ligase [Candidatus Erwinia haradaeae]|uniref:Alanine--tRNA ligase n=1 Tax=Candidatus Erwinia haradaeae TaxID=1922217 RepID=A0A451D3D6_9GAMM|nr:alanine--tRNA ligase [Candidatus Erwinia haradaeae]VFP80171.1 Alanine--tRNA ligase [Candidatus Erwinia haradaeae]